MTKRILLFPLLLLALSFAFQACDDDESYSDKRKRENKQIKSFLKYGCEVVDDDSGEDLLYVEGNINVISESEFYANDSTTNVDENEYVLFSSSGVYMQILDKGTGTKIEEGDSRVVIVRYTEYNISGDSIQTSNRVNSYEMIPDLITITNTYGVFSGSFVSGLMKTYYSSSAIPAGWLIPFEFVNVGRLDSDEASLAHVRLIVPSTQGQSDASSYIYPCFYDLTFQRGR